MGDKVVPARPWRIPEKVWVENEHSAHPTLCWRTLDPAKYKSPNDPDSDDYGPVQPGESRTWTRPTTKVKLEHHLDLLNDVRQVVRVFEKDEQGAIAACLKLVAKWGPVVMCGEHEGEIAAHRTGCMPAWRDDPEGRVFYEDLSWQMVHLILADAMVSGADALKRGTKPPLSIIKTLAGRIDPSLVNTRADVAWMIQSRLNMWLAGTTAVQVSAVSPFELTVGPTGFIGGLALALSAHLAGGSLGLVCSECGLLFTGRSNRKYCDGCSQSGARQRHAKRRFDQRQRQAPQPPVSHPTAQNRKRSPKTEQASDVRKRSRASTGE